MDLSLPICTTMPKRIRIALLAVALAGLSISPLAIADSEPFFGTVKGITRSNGLIVHADGGDLRQVVLAFLSIPYGEMPYADRATQILDAQLTGRRVSVRPIGEPQEQYVNGIVYVGKNNFNLDFLKRGHAWLDYYQVSHPAWQQTAQNAINAGVGLHANPDALHPLAYQIEKAKAMNIRAMTDAVANAPNIDQIMNETYVGHRSSKTFVPTNCVETWAAWPRAEHILFLTIPGAEDNGYKLRSCDDKADAK